MGQYHSVYNKTKKEYFSFGGAKLWGKVGDAHSIGFLLLLSNSNGRGGGDFYVQQEYTKKTYKPIPLKGDKKNQQDAINEISGRWAGDSIVVQGDYAEVNDPGFINETDFKKYSNISSKVLDAIEAIGYVGDDANLIKYVKEERGYLR